MRIVGVATLVLIPGLGGVALAGAGPLSLSTVVSPPTVSAMSEPALLLWLGAGLFVSATVMRRRRQNRS